MADQSHIFIAHAHFDRQWRRRNCERVYVFANGHVYDKAERRKGLRSCIRVMRHEKEWAAAELEQQTGQTTPRA